MSKPTFKGTKDNAILKGIANRVRTIYHGYICGSTPAATLENSKKIAFYAVKYIHNYKGDKEHIIPLLYTKVGKYMDVQELTPIQMRVKGAELLLAIIDVGEQYSSSLDLVRSFR